MKNILNAYLYRFAILHTCIKVIKFSYSQGKVLAPRELLVIYYGNVGLKFKAV